MARYRESETIRKEMCGSMSALARRMIPGFVWRQPVLQTIEAGSQHAAIISSASGDVLLHGGGNLCPNDMYGCSNVVNVLMLQCV